MIDGTHRLVEAEVLSGVSARADHAPFNRDGEREDVIMRVMN